MIKNNINNKKESQSNLISELKALKNSSDFDLEENELKVLKNRIETEASVKEDKKLKAFAFPQLVTLFKMLMQNRSLLAAVATVFVVLLSVGILLLGQNFIKQDDKFAVVGTYPNLETPPHPVQEPLQVTFSKEIVDLTILEKNIDLEPDVEFRVEYNSEDQHKVLIIPETNFEPNIQYQVTILAGDYGADYVLEEDYVYYFLTQADHSDSVQYTTLYWTDSYYNENHTYDLNIASYFAKDLDVPEMPKNVDITVYKSSSEQAINSLKTYIGLLKDSANIDKPAKITADMFMPNSNDLEPLGTVNVEVMEGEYGSLSLKTDLPISEKGVYIVEVKAFGKVIKSNYALISTYGIQQREIQLETQAIVQSFKDSKVMEGINVDVYTFDKSEGLKLIQQTASDNNGFISLSSKSQKDLNIMISEQDGELVLLSNTETLTQYPFGDYAWFNNYDEQLLHDLSQQEYYIITDRSLYKPGETIYYKIIGRSNNRDMWNIFQAELKFNASYYSYSSGERKDLKDMQIKLNENGAYWGEMKIPDNDDLDWVSIAVSNIEYDYTYIYSGVKVTSFDKPPYEVNINFDKSAYQNGGSATLSIEVKDYDGTPLKNEYVNIYASTNNLWYQKAQDYGVCKDLYNYWYYYDYRNAFDYYKTDTVMLDGDGKATYTFTVSDNIVNRVGELSAIVSYGDQYGSQSVGSTGAAFYPSQYYLKTYMDKYYPTKGETTYFNTEIIDQSCQPVTNLSASYTLSRQVGPYSYEDVSTSQFTSDAFGKLEEPLKIEENGSYRVTAKVGTYGGEVASSTYFSVYNDNQLFSSYFDSNNELAFEFDKEEYNVGDTAVVTVYHPGMGGDLWFTVDRNYIHESRIIQISGYKTEITFEVKGEYVPTADVKIGIFSNNKYFQGNKSFNVNLASKEIDIEVTSNQETYSPGEEVILTVKTTNQGNPIQSDVAMSIVDKRLLDLQRDELYWTYYSLYSTFYGQYSAFLRSNDSLENINGMLDPGGTGAGGGGDLRSNFANTAYWNPSIQTDANGIAQISFIMPDNLTKWGISTWAVSSDTKVGENISYIQTKKDLKIQSFIPETLLEGDIIEVTAKLVNSTESVQNTNLVITLPENISLVEGPSKYPISVEPSSEGEVKWLIKADKVSKGNKVQIETEGGTDYDGIEFNVDIFGRTYGKAKSYSDFGNATFSFNTNVENENYLNIKVYKSVKDLIISISKYSNPNLTDKILNHNIYKDNAEYIIGGQNYVDSLKSKIDEEAKYIATKQLQSGGIEQTYSNYLFDASPFTTLDSLAAFGHAISEGYLGYKENADKALTWLEKNSRSVNDEALVLMYQSEFYIQSVDNTKFNTLYSKIDEMSDLGISSMLIASKNLSKTTEANKLKEELLSRSIEVNGAIHWKETFSFGTIEEGFYDSMNTNYLGFYALIKSGDYNSSEKALNWIINNYGNIVSNYRGDYLLEKGLILFDKLSTDKEPDKVNVRVDGKLITLNNDGIYLAPDKYKDEGFSLGSHIVEVEGVNGQLFLSSIQYSENNEQVNLIDSNTLDLDVSLRDANGNKITSLKEGQFGIVVFQFNSNTELESMLVTSFIPSGLEVIDPSLLNSVVPAEITNSQVYKTSARVNSSYNNGRVLFENNNRISSTPSTFIAIVRGRNAGTYKLGPTSIFGINNLLVWEVVEGQEINVVK